MKKGIHPEYHEINVTRTDGKTVKMYSSVKKEDRCKCFLQQPLLPSPLRREMFF